MNFNTVKDSAGFIAFALSKVQTTGLLLILKEYSERQGDVAGASVRAWYQNMRDGKSYRDALVQMSPRFDSSIEQILIESMENSCLDYALAEIDAIIRQDITEQATQESIRLLADKYINISSTEFICEGCLAREFEKILQRAKNEHAFEVLFEQDGERFFTQLYLGSTAVKVVEPCHSKVYRTLQRKLDELTGSNNILELLNTRFTVNTIRGKSYNLHSAEMALIMTFQ